MDTNWFIHLSKRNIRIIHIDLSIPIEQQGNLDLIVHKMTDLVAKIERGDTEAAKLYQRFIVSWGIYSKCVETKLGEYLGL